MTSYHPVYDYRNNVIAHYITFKPSGYAIVNNNIYNPIVLEFSANSNVYEELLASFPEGQQLQYSNLSFDDKTILESSPELADRYAEFVSTLSKLNSSEAEEHQALRFVAISLMNDAICTESLRFTLNSSVTLQDLHSSWGIIDWDDMPTGSYYARNLPELWNINWGTTTEFWTLGEDHCGTVAAFNVVNYYSVRYSALYPHRPLLVTQSTSGRRNSFSTLHSYIGDGPRTPPTVSVGILRYVEEDIGGHSYTGGSGGTWPTWSWSNFRSRLNSRQMHIAVIGKGNDLHYVNIVGYREYSSGANYLRIVDNWTNSYDWFMHHSRILYLWYTYIH